MQMGRTLLSPEVERTMAESFASEIVGTVWATRTPGDREVLDAWLQEVVRYAALRGTPAAASLLAALRTVLDEPALDSELEQWGSELLDGVPWVTEPTPRPRAVTRSTDVWNDVATWFLEYDDCVLDVLTRRYQGGSIGSITLFDHEVLKVWDDEVTTSGGEMTPRVAVPVEEAVRELQAAYKRTEMFWPPNDDEDYERLGHLLAARLRALPVAPLEEPEWEPMSDEAKEELIARFFADLQLELDDTEAVREVLDALLWYGDGYVTGGALAWSPPIVELFLLDWLPRKTFFQPDVVRLVPTVTYAWTGWAAVQAGVPKEWAEQAAAVALELADEFYELYDGSEKSPATEIAQRIAEAGLDPLADQAAVDEIVSAYNAEQLARRLQGGS